MTRIRCAGCNWQSSVCVGSLGERDFLRVVDATRACWEPDAERRAQAHRTGFAAQSRPYKDYYCSETCYLDRAFLRSVAARAGVDARQCNWHSSPVGVRELIDVMTNDYDAIVASARDSAGMRAFRARRGAAGVAPRSLGGRAPSAAAAMVTAMAAPPGAETGMGDWADVSA
jgi:hypothetical protein